MLCDGCREASPGFSLTPEGDEVYTPPEERPCSEAIGPFSLVADQREYPAGSCCKPMPAPLTHEAGGVLSTFLIVYDQWIMSFKGPVTILLSTARDVAHDLGIDTRGDFWTLFRTVLNRRVKWLPKAPESE